MRPALTPRGNTREFRGRLLLAIWGVGAAITMLLIRLYSLQILRGEELTHKGRRNFVQTLTVPHDRGIIFDRRGRILVDNRPSLNLSVTPHFLGRGPAAQKTLARMAELVGMPEDELLRVRDQVEAKVGLERFRPLVVRRDLEPDQVEAVENERSLFLLDGVEIVEGRRRTYPFGALAAHTFGYVNEIDASALDAERARGNPDRYELGDIVGRDGLERHHERELRGVDGNEKVVVDAKGRRLQSDYVEALLGEQRRVEPQPGHNLYLTLDLELQQRAEAAFLRRGRAGSVVALDVRTGAVLALVSLPAFDSNLLSGAQAKLGKVQLDGNPLKPWLNRSIAGQYAPGSTFKVATALAALKEHALQAHERIVCPGHYRMNRHIWRCWRDAGHGPMDLHAAMRSSCDTFFYTLAGRLGLGPIAEAARALGFGARTGIGLRGEQPGIVPTEAFHNRADASSGGYQRGMAINTSIGQGALLVTPLQLAVAYATVAHGQAVKVPQLVDRVESADLRTTRRFVPELQALAPDVTDRSGVPLLLLPAPQRAVPAPREAVAGEGPTVLSHLPAPAAGALPFAEEDLAAVRDGLQAVANEPGGTAFWIRPRKVRMAAKTGTAQVVRLGRERLKDWETGYLERDHAWFVGYAPLEAPEIVVAVLNEHAGHGGSAAGPIAAEILDAYFAAQDAEGARGLSR